MERLATPRVAVALIALACVLGFVWNRASRTESTETPPTRIVPGSIRPAWGEFLHVRRSGGCWDDGPTYELLLHPDGVVEFRGEHLVAETGRRRHEVRADVFAELRRSLLDEAVLDAPPSRYSHALGPPTLRVELGLGTESLSRADCLGLPETQDLDRFAARMIAAVGAGSWIDG